MLQELEVLIEHDFNNYVKRMLFHFRKDEGSGAYCFLTDLEIAPQLHAFLSRERVEELIAYLKMYLKELDNDE